MTFNKEKTVSYYDDLLDKHGDHFRALDWKSKESQQLRFFLFSDIFQIGKKRKNLKVLDVGCGFGDFFGYLSKEKYLRRLKIDYTGYDISPRLLDLAKKKYPKARFELKNIMEEIPSDKFDYVFCSGALNIRFTEETDHLEFVRTMLLRMWELCGSGAVVNFLSAAALPLLSPESLNKKQYYYFRPEDILSFVRFLTGRFIVRHDYHVGDFTVYLLK